MGGLVTRVLERHEGFYIGNDTHTRQARQKQVTFQSEANTVRRRVKFSEARPQPALVEVIVGLTGTKAGSKSLSSTSGRTGGGKF
jgi:hypothetical protein